MDDSLVQFLKLSKCIEKHKDVIESVYISPVNEQYPLNSNYMPCSKVLMNVYFADHIDAKVIKDFEEMGFLVKESDWDVVSVAIIDLSAFSFTV